MEVVTGVELSMMEEFVVCDGSRHRRQIKDDLEFNASSSLCPSCLKRKEIPHFFSRLLQWGTDNPTQKLVQMMKWIQEENTNLQCLFDDIGQAYFSSVCSCAV